MNSNKFHNMLERRKRACGIIKTNCVRFPEDPSNMIDCTPEGNYENFKGLVDGCGFYYCEVSNSTPMQEGYRIKDEDRHLVKLYKNILCVFDEEGLECMGRQLVGKRIFYYANVNYRETVGIVTDAWMWRIRKSDRYSVLSVIFKLNGRGKEFASQLGNKINFDFGLVPEKSRYFCCECGKEVKSDHRDTPCGLDYYRFVKNPILESHATIH